MQIMQQKLPVSTSPPPPKKLIIYKWSLMKISEHCQAGALNPLAEFLFPLNYGSSLSKKKITYKLKDCFQFTSQQSPLCFFFFSCFLGTKRNSLLQCPLLIWVTSEGFHWIGILNLDQFKFKQKIFTSNPMLSIVVWHYICNEVANLGNLCHMDRQSIDHRTICVCQTTAGVTYFHKSLEVHSG